MPYPATLYNVVTALEDSNAPLTVDEIIEKGDIISDSKNRAVVKAILTKLSNANLVSSTHPIVFDGGEVGYIIKDDNTGVEIKKQDGFNREYHDNVCTQIQVASEFNDTLGSYILGASYLDSLGAPAENLLKKLDLLDQLINTENHLAPSLDTYRYTLFTQLKKLAQSVLGDKEYQSFYDSF